VVEFHRQAFAPGGEDTLFGIAEALQGEGGEGIEGALQAVEALDDGGGLRAEGRAFLIQGLGGGAAGIAQQVLARGLVARGVEGVEEGLGLPDGEHVPLDDIGQEELTFGRSAAEPQGEGEAETSGVEAADDLSAQLLGEQVAPLDPGAFSAQELGHGGGVELVVGDEGSHDARLVHGAEGLGGAVGKEHERLPFGRGGLLNEGVHVALTFLLPVFQAFESVQDFVEALGLGGSDPQGHGCKLGGGVGALAAQVGKALQQAGDGEKDEGVHELASGGSSS
jgi:hypothetical protein